MQIGIDLSTSNLGLPYLAAQLFLAGMKAVEAARGAPPFVACISARFTECAGNGTR